MKKKTNISKTLTSSESRTPTSATTFTQIRAPISSSVVPPHQQISSFSEHKEAEQLTDSDVQDEEQETTELLLHKNKKISTFNEPEKTASKSFKESFIEPAEVQIAEENDKVISLQLSEADQLSQKSPTKQPDKKSKKRNQEKLKRKLTNDDSDNCSITDQREKRKKKIQSPHKVEMKQSAKEFEATKIATTAIDEPKSHVDSLKAVKIGDVSNHIASSSKTNEKAISVGKKSSEIQSPINVLNNGSDTPSKRVLRSQNIDTELSTLKSHDSLSKTPPSKISPASKKTQTKSVKHTKDDPAIQKDIIHEEKATRQLCKSIALVESEQNELEQSQPTRRSSRLNNDVMSPKKIIFVKSDDTAHVKNIQVKKSTKSKTSSVSAGSVSLQLDDEEVAQSAESQTQFESDSIKTLKFESGKEKDPQLTQKVSFELKPTPSKNKTQESNGSTLTKDCSSTKKSKLTPSIGKQIDVEPSKSSKETSFKISPSKISPSKILPSKNTPSKNTPTKTTPTKSTPTKTTPGKTTPGKTTPGKTTPYQPTKRTPKLVISTKEANIVALDEHNFSLVEEPTASEPTASETEKIVKEVPVQDNQGKESKGQESKVVKFNWQSKRRSGRLRRRLDDPIVIAKSNDQLDDKADTTKSNDQLDDLTDVAKSNDQLKDIADTTKSNDQLEDIADTTKSNNQLEDIADTTKSNNQLEDIADTTKSNNQLEDITDVAKSNDQLKDIADTTKSNNQLEDIADTTKSNDQLKDITDITKSNDQLEDITDVAREISKDLADNEKDLSNDMNEDDNVEKEVARNKEGDDANLLSTIEAHSEKLDTQIDYKELSEEHEEILREGSQNRVTYAVPQHKTEEEEGEELLKDDFVHNDVISTESGTESEYLQANNKTSAPPSELKFEEEIPSPIFSESMSREDEDDFIVVCQDSDDDDEIMRSPPVSPFVQRGDDTEGTKKNSQYNDDGNEPVSKSSLSFNPDEGEAEGTETMKEFPPKISDEKKEKLSLSKDPHVDSVDSDDKKNKKISVDKNTELIIESSLVNHTDVDESQTLEKSSEVETNISASELLHKTRECISTNSHIKSDPSLKPPENPQDASQKDSAIVIPPVSSDSFAIVQHTIIKGEEKEQMDSGERFKEAPKKLKDEGSIEQPMSSERDEVKTLQSQFREEVDDVLKKIEEVHSTVAGEKKEQTKLSSPPKAYASSKLSLASPSSSSYSQAPRTPQASSFQQSIKNIKKEGSRLSQRFKYSKLGALRMSTQLPSCSQQQSSDIVTTITSTEKYTADKREEKEVQHIEAVTENVAEKERTKLNQEDEDSDDIEDIDFSIELTGKSAFLLLSAAGNESEDSEVEILDNREEEKVQREVNNLDDGDEIDNECIENKRSNEKVDEKETENLIVTQNAGNGLIYVKDEQSKQTLKDEEEEKTATVTTEQSIQNVRAEEVAGEEEDTSCQVRDLLDVPEVKHEEQALPLKSSNQTDVIIPQNPTMALLSLEPNTSQVNFHLFLIKI